MIASLNARLACARSPRVTSTRPRTNRAAADRVSACAAAFAADSASSYLPSLKSNRACVVSASASAGFRLTSSDRIACASDPLPAP